MEIKNKNHGYTFFVMVVCGALTWLAVHVVCSITFFMHFSLDRYISCAMKDWHVPGLAIAIVQDDKIIHMKGYGVLEHGSNQKVDENTIFAIGSCSKAFTVAALGLLVDDGVLTWEDKAHTYLPELQLPNECITKELDIRDMLSHRSGLEEVGMLWDHGTLSRHELIQKVRFLKQVVGFREGWVYNNLFYLSAGEIIPVITGMSWDNFITHRIFKPLGMNSSSTSIRSLLGTENVASPHYCMNDIVYTVPYHNIDSIAPAGGINSTIKDMAQWVKMLVNNGVYNQTPFLQEQTAAELYYPQTIVKKQYPCQLYGLGLGIFDYKCHEVVFHEGNIDGMSASFAMMPAKKCGVIILTNMHRGIIGKVLINTLFDRYLQVSSTDWNGYFSEQERMRKVKFFDQEEEMRRNRIEGLMPTLNLSVYSGVYHNDVYDDVIVKENNNQLECSFLQFNGMLQHWQEDTFTFNPSGNNPLFPSLFYITFNHDKKSIKGLSIHYEDIWTNDMDADFVKK